MLNNLRELVNLWICLSLKIWSKVIAQNNLKEAVKVLRWYAFDNFFLPYRWDAIFNRWTLQDLTACCTFLHKGTMNSFQNLKRQFGSDKDDFYRFLQVRYYTDQMQKRCALEGWDNILLKVFIEAYLPCSNQRLISRIYKGLQ